MSVKITVGVLGFGFLLAACGGSEGSTGDGGRGGSSGSAGAAAGKGGTAGGGRGGSGGSGTAGENGEAGAESASGGADSNAGAGGGDDDAGASGAASAGAAGTSAGAGGASGSNGGGDVNGPLDWTPPENGVVVVPSGDEFNSTPPVLASTAAGIVIAGATSDVELAGVPMFETGIQAEAFVAELDFDGEKLWSVALPDAGLPSAVAVDAAGNIVVLAAFLPDSPSLFPGQYGNSAYLAKISPAGDVLYERELAFGQGTMLQALALDPAGAIYVGGSQRPDDDFPNEYVFIGKYDAQGEELWTNVFQHEGSTAYVAAMTLEPGGDAVVAGTFNGSMNLGGEALVSDAIDGSSMLPNGFYARFTPEGDHVYSDRFGGTIFDGGSALLALSDGDILLGGFLSGLASVGGQSTNADVADGSAFLARLDPTGQARFVALAGVGMTHAIVKDADESNFYVTGDLGGSDYLTEFSADGSPGDSASVSAGALITHSATVDALGSVWIAASSMDQLDFGNGNALTGGPAGTYVVRLDRAPAGDL